MFTFFKINEVTNAGDTDGMGKHRLSPYRKTSNTSQVSNTSWVSTWYQLAQYGTVSDDIASAVSEISGLDNAELGRGIYCFDKVKCKCVW